MLEAGGSGLDAVEVAVVVLEDDPTFDAGRGSFLNADGVVELDAGVMTGAELDVGSVAAVQGIRNPVRLARLVLTSEHTMLAGEGARRFGLERGIEPCDPGCLVVERERRRWQELAGHEVSTRSFFEQPRGTVGAVARDARGDLAAATSTGGTPMKPPGRIGDTPIVGAGFYAANELGAISASGWGEAFVRLLLSYRVALLAGEGLAAPEACQEGLRLLERLDARGGLVMVDAAGRPGVAYSTPAMAFAHRATGEETVAGP